LSIKVKAIILAAGRSSRLYPITIDRPKCLLKVGRQTVIEHQISWLRACGIKDILVVTGYLHKMIEQHLGSSVRYSFYDKYAKTNNLYTLYSVRDDMDDDLIILFSDVLISLNILKKCMSHDSEMSLIVDTHNVTDKTMRVCIADKAIIDIGSHISVEEADGNFVGIGKFTKKSTVSLLNKMEELVDKNMYSDDYYTIALSKLAFEGYPIRFVDSCEEYWVEMDTQDDYERVLESHFAIS
tara:strand:+ start:954 stop:1673 length:720 start_codon:yes stop_codon:yes gene_type:complete